MNKNLSKITPFIILFGKIYLTVLLIFSLFRLALYFTERTRAADSPWSEIAQAFVMGLRFDLVISSYILALPFLLMAVYVMFKRKSRVLEKIMLWFIFVMFTLSFIVCAADIPYFNQFFARFSVSAFQWMDSPMFMLKMIGQEPRYWLVIIPLLLLLYLFYRLLRRFFNTFSERDIKDISIGLTPIFSIVCLGLIFLAMRGRIEKKSPIRVGTAYFSNNAFLNQLGLNPNFTLMRSYLDAKREENQSINLMDNLEALELVHADLGMAPEAINEQFPLARAVHFDSLPAKDYNVVIVIMESMSAAKMTRHGNPDKLTPFLDSLSNEGLYYENAYTSGIHTMNGIFSTLFSFPALFRQHPMKESQMLRYNGIFNVLKQNDYSTIYFSTHDGQFDNVEGFLKGNDCETVIAKPNYPSEKVKTTLGVPDDFMFEFSIPILNDLHQKNKPFVCAMMTTSDHGPYYIPDYFTPKSKEVRKGIVEYADWSLRKFISMASKQAWFNNTIFVFVADHGAAMDNLYDISLDYNHSPLLFYAPKIIAQQESRTEIASQIDIFPTIMGLLQIPFVNNTLGVDLVSSRRRYAIINADDKFGVMDEEWLLILRNDGSKALHKYKQKDLKDYQNENPEQLAEMERYGKSQLQAYQYLKDRNMLFME